MDSATLRSECSDARDDLELYVTNHGECIRQAREKPIALDEPAILLF